MYASLPRFPTDLFAELDRMQRQLQQWAGQTGGPSGIRFVGRDAYPLLNVGNTTETVEVYAFLPGLDSASIEVSIDKGLLIVAGERASSLPQANQKQAVYARERFAGRFRRVLDLPEDVDPSLVDASYTNGVLRIVMQKREVSRPRRIEVK